MKSFACSGHAGDIIWWLPSMIDLAGHETFKLYLKCNTPSPVSDHPCGPVLMTTLTAHSLITLLMTQPYISQVTLWSGEEVDLDFDLIRCANVDLRGIPVGLMPCLIAPVRPELSEPWLFLADDVQPEPVIVSRTKRYRNNAIRYPNLGKFVGLESENDLGLEWIETHTILDLAQQIAGCEVFVGNQSLAYALASALDKPRLLECCPWSPNVPPNTSNAYWAWNQGQFDEGLKNLMGA